MSTSPQPMRINHDELFSDEVEEFLGVRRQQTREIGESVQQPFLIRMFYASWFYLSIASGVNLIPVKWRNPALPKSAFGLCLIKSSPCLRTQLSKSIHVPLRMHWLTQPNSDANGM